MFLLENVHYQVYHVFGVVHKWRHGLRREGSRILRRQYEGFSNKTHGGGGSNIVQTCVTSFVDDPFGHGSSHLFLMTQLARKSVACFKNDPKVMQIWVVTIRL